MVSFNFDALKVGGGRKESKIKVKVDWATGEWTASGNFKDLKDATPNENGTIDDFSSETQGALRLNIMQMAILNPKKNV